MKNPFDIFDAADEAPQDNKAPQANDSNPISFERQGAQGDLLVLRVDAIPAGYEPVEAVEGGHIVAHSETGHHHWLSALADSGQPSSVCYLRAVSEEMLAYVEIGGGEGAELVHHRPTDTHATLLLKPGIYELRRQREYTPEGARRVED